MKPTRLHSVFLALALTFTMSPAMATEADSSDTTQQIVQLTPGTTIEEVETAAANWSLESGLSLEETYALMLEQAMEAREEHKRAATAQSTNSAFRSNPFAANRQLPNSSFKGDVFYADSKVQPYGHVGIFGGTTWIVEAPGPGKRSTWEWTKDKRVVAGAKFIWFKVSQSTQDAAADYAYRHLLNYPYNYKFFDNKELNPSHLNCSQLVWLAYKKGAGIDIDGDGGPGVYPGDILESPLAHHYYTVH
nr:hypothetical protein [Actinomyces sp.]